MLFNNKLVKDNIVNKDCNKQLRNNRHEKNYNWDERSNGNFDVKKSID